MSPAALLLSALLAAPATLPATLPTTGPAVDVASVDALVAQLADPDAAARDKAQRALLALPDAALMPRLQAARKAAREPDVQLRLDTLIVQVQERVDVGGSRITLKFDRAPLNLVLDAIEAQAHANFGNLGDEFAVNNGLAGNGNPNAMPLVTIDLQDASFWRAVAEVQDQANVLFMPQPDGWRVTRNFGQPSMVRGSESGAFLVQPTMANYQRSVVYARNVGGGGEYFSLQFQMLAEPKVRLAAANGTLNIDRAVDSNGNDLLGGGQRMQQISTGQGQGAIGCALQLKYPKNPGATISEISGTMRLSMARRVETIAGEDVMGPAKVQAQVEGTKITIEPYPNRPENAQPRGNPNGANPNGVNPNGGDPAPVDLLITLAVARGSADPQAVMRLQQSINQQLRVTDARGAAMRLTSYSVSRSDGQRAEIRATYASNQPQQSRGPYKVRLEVPTSYREIEVPFALRDLKMP